MRALTRIELRKLAKAAGLRDDDPMLFNGYAEALIRIGIEVGMRMRRPPPPPPPHDDRQAPLDLE